MIYLDRFEPWHYEYLCGTLGLGLAPETISFYANHYYHHGDTYSIKVDGRVVACFGIVQMWPGVAEAWSLLTDEVKQYPVFLHKKVKAFLDNVLEQRQYHRTQATARVDEPVNARWLARLGFEYETTLKKFNSDQVDSYMYVRGMS